MKIPWRGLFDLAISRKKWHSLPRPTYAWVGIPSLFPSPPKYSRSVGKLDPKISYFQLISNLWQDSFQTHKTATKYLFDVSKIVKKWIIIWLHLHFDWKIAWKWQIERSLDIFPYSATCIINPFKYFSKRAHQGISKLCYFNAHMNDLKPWHSLSSSSLI